jgi:hypothetical protein
MKHTFDHSPKAYSIIVSITMIGFLLVLTTSTLNLVLQEMQDGRGRQDYMKAYAGAEWSLELALLLIKEEWYGYSNTVNDSDILKVWPKDPLIGYTFNGKVQSYTGTLEAYGTDIIPLFYIDDDIISITQANLNSWVTVSWNIVGEQGGISWIWSFDSNTPTWQKSLEEIWWNQDFTFSSDIKIQDFLTNNTGSYLVLYNTENLPTTYTFSSSDFFTEPRSTIRSTARVWKYTQNLETMVDNTEFLGMLKYSIYSWE